MGGNQTNRGERGKEALRPTSTGACSLTTECYVTNATSTVQRSDAAMAHLASLSISPRNDPPLPAARTDACAPHAAQPQQPAARSPGDGRRPVPPPVLARHAVRRRRPAAAGVEGADPRRRQPGCACHHAAGAGSPGAGRHPPHVSPPSPAAAVAHAPKGSCIPRGRPSPMSLQSTLSPPRSSTSAASPRTSARRCTPPTTSPSPRPSHARCSRSSHHSSCPTTPPDRPASSSPASQTSFWTLSSPRRTCSPSCQGESSSRIPTAPRGRGRRGRMPRRNGWKEGQATWSSTTRGRQRWILKKRSDVLPRDCSVWSPR